MDGEDITKGIKEPSGIGWGGLAGRDCGSAGDGKDAPAETGGMELMGQDGINWKK